MDLSGILEGILGDFFSGILGNVGGALTPCGVGFYGFFCCISPPSTPKYDSMSK